MRRVEVIFFDAAGTLFGVRGSVGEVYGRLALRHGVAADPEVLDRRFRDAFPRQPRPKAAPGADTADAERRWWRDLIGQVFQGSMEEEKLDAFFADAYEHFRGARAWRLYPDTIACLTSLRERGFRLGIISNFDSRLRDLLGSLDIARYFSSVTLSWEAGHAKPERGIFLSALESMRARADSALHVGDSLDEDVLGAESASIRAVLLDRTNRHSGAAVRLRIRSLGELVDNLGVEG